MTRTRCAIYTRKSSEEGLEQDFTPTHASKEGKRYRYYVSRRLVSGDGKSDATGWRLPADRLERDISIAVAAHLISCVDRGDIGAGDAASIDRLRQCIQALGIGCLILCAAAHLQDGTIRIILDRSKVAASVGLETETLPPDAHTFSVPFMCRRRGVETRLVIGAPHPARDDILIANVARAEQWRAALCNGDELATIAARDGITVKYLGEMLPFAFVSPKLVRAILEGRQPPALTTNWIRRHGLPLSWAEQDHVVAQL